MGTSPSPPPPSKAMTETLNQGEEGKGQKTLGEGRVKYQLSTCAKATSPSMRHRPKAGQGRGGEGRGGKLPTYARKTRPSMRRRGGEGRGRERGEGREGRGGEGGEVPTCARATSPSMRRSSSGFSCPGLARFTWPHISTSLSRDTPDDKSTWYSSPVSIASRPPVVLLATSW